MSPFSCLLRKVQWVPGAVQSCAAGWRPVPRAVPQGPCQPGQPDGQLEEQVRSICIYHGLQSRSIPLCESHWHRSALAVELWYGVIQVHTVYVFKFSRGKIVQKPGSAKYICGLTFHEYVACLVLRPVAEKFCGFYFRKCTLTREICENFNICGIHVQFMQWALPRPAVPHISLIVENKCTCLRWMLSFDTVYREYQYVTESVCPSRCVKGNTLFHMAASLGSSTAIEVGMLTTYGWVVPFFYQSVRVQFVRSVC